MRNRGHMKRHVPQPESSPTPERLAKAGESFQIGGDERSGKIIRIMDSPLERMMAKRMLDGKEFEALNKFRIHWWHAGLSGSPQSPDLNRVFASDPTSGAGMASTERQAHHRKQYRDARAIFEQTTENHKMLIVLDNVLFAEQSLEMAGYAVGCKSRSRAFVRSQELLKKAAQMLIRHWGI